MQPLYVLSPERNVLNRLFANIFKLLNWRALRKPFIQRISAENGLSLLRVFIEMWSLQATWADHKVTRICQSEALPAEIERTASFCRIVLSHSRPWLHSAASGLEAKCWEARASSTSWWWHAGTAETTTSGRRSTERKDGLTRTSFHTSRASKTFTPKFQKTHVRKCY